MEVLTKVKPNYKNMKVFGCLCLPYLRPYNKHKLQFRSSPCTFLGYANGFKGHKCLDKNGKVIISRHVIFNEYEFPFDKEHVKATRKVDNPK